MSSHDMVICLIGSPVSIRPISAGGRARSPNMLDFVRSCALSDKTGGLPSQGWEEQPYPDRRSGDDGSLLYGHERMSASTLCSSDAESRLIPQPVRDHICRKLFRIRVSEFAGPVGHGTSPVKAVLERLHGAFCLPHAHREHQPAISRTRMRACT